MTHYTTNRIVRTRESVTKGVIVPNNTTIVTVREVTLLLMGSRHQHNNKLTEISVIIFGRTEAIRADLQARIMFPSFRVVKNLSRKYLSRNALLDSMAKSHVTPHNCIRFNVAEGTTIEERAIFLAALAARTRMKETKK